MTIENEVEKLKAISDDAANTRDIARKDYDVAMDPSIGDYSTCGTPGAAKIAYKTAAKAASAARDDYIAEKEKEENKMKTDNKMVELKVTAITTRKARAAAFTTYSDACLATDAAWDAYTAAATASHKAATDSHVYEARTYGCYADED